VYCWLDYSKNYFSAGLSYGYFLYAIHSLLEMVIEEFILTYVLVFNYPGRTHRSNQVTAPEYVFLISELAGEQRFASIVAKRLESLVRLFQETWSFI